MKTKDFEKAIDALGVQEMEIIKFSYQLNGGVAAVYARMGERTYLKWDANGRGYCIDIEGMVEIEAAERYPGYLDYRRDRGFDLKFE